MREVAARRRLGVGMLRSPTNNAVLILKQREDVGICRYILCDMRRKKAADPH